MTDGNDVIPKITDKAYAHTPEIQIEYIILEKKYIHNYNQFVKK